MNEDSYGDLVDLFYNASFEPELWIPAMEHFADLIGGTGAWLSNLNMVDGTGDGVISRIDPVMRGVYQEYYTLRNPLSNVENPREYLRTWVPRILSDEDWMPKDELMKTEYYNDFMQPQDVHSALMIRLAKEGCSISVLSINRPKRSGQFERAEREKAQRLHPHLIRAYTLGRKFAKVSGLSESLVETLDRSPHGIVLLDPDGRIRHINRLAESLVTSADGVCVTGGRLSAVESEAAKQLAGLIASAAAPQREGARGGSMALPSRSRRLPLSVTVAPARAERIDIFGRGPAVLVCITDLEAGVSVPAQKLRDLFGLTPAEARVMLALFEGFTPQEAADNLGVSFHTVRVHLGRIFEKTGAHRQTELVRLTMRTVGMLRD